MIKRKRRTQCQDAGLSRRHVTDRVIVLLLLLVALLVAAIGEQLGVDIRALVRGLIVS